ncbi:hypothetical protein BpHYR1_000752 [Brachionus plicatilis]|uniref:Uncharacterized protein n=1 Tax=Brachionus plicatilis TaxID=10195 RepID=A0A3M7S301_BRAPC|nr:hypothetical protein BpHYR1_000752 [Brachionus plicatilis]
MFIKSILVGNQDQNLGLFSALFMLFFRSFEIKNGKISIVQAQNFYMNKKFEYEFFSNYVYRCKFAKSGGLFIRGLNCIEYSTLISQKLKLFEHSKPPKQLISPNIFSSNFTPT